MVSFLKPSPASPPLPDDQIDPEYKRLRFRVFLGIFIGYAAYYLVRKNFSLAMPDILKAYPQYGKEGLGIALTGLSIAYGLSKFLMGSISDRSNPRWFLSLGLILTASVTASFGMFDYVYSSLVLIVVLQSLNGWFNGMGWPPCGKTMVHWFSIRERGRTVSIWNLAHNIGGALVAKFALFGVWLFGDWGATFYFNALIAFAMAILVMWLMRDTPQSCGLPPIEVYRNDYPPDYSAQHEENLSFKAIFMEHILRNKLLWYIAVANAFVYFVRYGVVDWIPTYFNEAKGLSLKESATAWAMFEYAAIPGTLLCGWMSDKVFRGKRAPATILFMGVTTLAILIYWLNLNGPLWIDYLALICVGFLIYGPVMLIGLHALDLVPKKAAGTAAGFTGFFGYAFGSGLAGWGVGWMAEKFGWGGVFALMIVCCVLTMILCAMTLRHHLHSAGA